MLMPRIFLKYFLETVAPSPLRVASISSDLNKERLSLFALRMIDSSGSLKYPVRQTGFELVTEMGLG